MEIDLYSRNKYNFETINDVFKLYDYEFGLNELKSLKSFKYIIEFQNQGYGL